MKEKWTPTLDPKVAGELARALLAPFFPDANAKEEEEERKETQVIVSAHRDPEDQESDDNEPHDPSDGCAWPSNFHRDTLPGCNLFKEPGS
jgi:hypothetical protein